MHVTVGAAALLASAWRWRLRRACARWGAIRRRRWPRHADGVATRARQCLGRALAVVMHDVAVATLLAQFSFRLSEQVRRGAGPPWCRAAALFSEACLPHGRRCSEHGSRRAPSPPTVALLDWRRRLSNFRTGGQETWRHEKLPQTALHGAVHHVSSCGPGRAQMGGAAGVEAAEVNCLTLQPGAGLLMRAVPRVAA
jgi:hypothetical protein